MNSEKVISRTLSHSGYLAPPTGLEPVFNETAKRNITLAWLYRRLRFPTFSRAPLRTLASVYRGTSVALAVSSTGRARTQTTDFARSAVGRIIANRDIIN